MADPLFWDEEGRLSQTLRWDSWFSERYQLSFISHFVDAKKSVWVPDGEGGFDEAMIDSVDGDKVNVKVGWEPKTFKSAQVMQVNPPKMEKFDGRKSTLQLQLICICINIESSKIQIGPDSWCTSDVSNMTYLNEAAVLWNLKARYVSKLIYTYSGLL